LPLAASIRQRRRWIETATGELIGPDPSIEKPLTEEDQKNARPFSEASPELYASIQRNKARSPQKRRS
jgi:hypothetical protein